MISNIYSKNNDPAELEVVELIKSVCNKYDIPQFTNTIVVEKGAIPHSHPVLTLSARIKDERLVLKTLVHEQFHWYSESHSKSDECISYLKSKYVDDGEHNKSGTYPDSYWGHIIVCFNTRAYLKNIVSPKDLEWIYEQWQPYPTLEKLIVQRYEEIRADLEKFDIIFIS